MCAALVGVAGLTGCDDRAQNKMWASIQAIEVDAREHKDTPADPRKLSPKDISLAVKTAKDLTVNDDGLFDRKRDTKLEIAVVDPLDVPRPEGAPLDARPSGVVFDLAQVARELPDIPVADVAREAVRASAAVAAPEVAKAATSQVVTKTATPEVAVKAAKNIQVGSFGTLLAAQQAWETLRDTYPAAEGLKPSYEKVVTGSGKSLVRLKVGPVKSDAQARGLCDALDVRDSWCARAG
ncbi:MULTISPECIES: SPOR domain-containing protein [Asticcacaulis]|uniref:SPOR domain-containing protein n=1 Tax=Asticcacaulis TaxID=76890 RepID=UPI001AE7EA73|nr:MULTISPECIES: SPOR domain-containing protein [Asticcacaulis]MBP2158708.1 hypothetical protein [Asticcacaulis solisilvae]MDR6799754.1 hypothetical protein [Asticcacaulis sp. BE141]